MYLTRFRTYKIALAPQTKPSRGGGHRHLPPRPFTSQFLRKADIKGLVSLQLFGPGYARCGAAARQILQIIKRAFIFKTWLERP